MPVLTCGFCSQQVYSTEISLGEKCVYAARAVFARVFYYENFIWGCLAIATKELQINEQIRDEEVRVIDDKGGQLGVMSSREAQRIADERDLDLVKHSPLIFNTFQISLALSFLPAYFLLSHLLME